jgi:hypothetical protein
MAVRLRPDPCGVAATVLVVVLALVPTAARPHAQATAARVPAEVLERVSRYVEAYYSRAQSLMVEETVTVQPVRGDLAPDGFARRLLYDLRFEWTPGSGDEKPHVDVVRQLLLANRRPARPGAEPKCLDPAPVTPEPLEFLLPTNHGDFDFSNGGLTRLDGRGAILLDYKPRTAGTPKATVDPKGTGDMDCLSLDTPRRYRGRIWVDPETDAVLRIDEALMGPTDVPVPRRVRHSFTDRITLMRADSTVRYNAVRFSDPDELLMLPTAIDNVWVTASNAIRGVRMTQEYRNYRRFLTTSRILPQP